MRSDPLRPTAIALAALVATAPSPAYVANGSWPDGTISLHLRLDGTEATPAIASGGLTDGSATWSAAITPAISAWSAQMTRCRISVAPPSTVTPASDNNRNELLFSSTIYGEAFGARTLAVTLVQSGDYSGTRLSETDLIFNTAVTWNSYRAALRSSPIDIRRVALHELGHVLGLDHPDEDNPVQAVAAVMNSTVSDVETLQSDDLAGLRVLYSSPVSVPGISRSPQDQTVAVGGTARMSLELGGSAAPAPSPTQRYAWIFTPAGGQTEYLFTFHDPEIPFGAAQTTDSGSYRVVVETPNGSVPSTPASLAVTPVTVSAATRLINLSTRAYAGSGSQTLIVGFVIGGGSPRRILLRAVGPTLASYGVDGAMADPSLTVVRSGDGQTVATNNDWGSDGGAASLPPVFEQAGAFVLPNGSRDAALTATLAPGVYTALVTANGGTAAGIALVEAYDIDSRTDSTSRLKNLSTRGYVGTDSSVMVAGLVVAGSGPRTFLIRGVGDSLQPFGVTGAVDDPILRIFDGPGNLLRWTDDWDSPEFLQPLLRQTALRVGAFDLTDRQECALSLTLNPGIYTVHLVGFNKSAGVGLVEIYDVEP